MAAQQVRDAAADAEGALVELAGRLGLEPAPAEEPLSPERAEELERQVERLARRREQLGPVNPLAGQEYEEAVAHVEELEAQRTDLESALAELESLIKETDRRIRASFEETFEATARNFEDVVQHLFPGGRGRLRLVHPDGPRPVLGGEEAPGADEAPEQTRRRSPAEPGVEVEVTPAGKAMKRLSLLSGGEKSLVALAFMFAVFLARPCPFYILDEVEAALDDLNIDRFLELIRRYSDRAQFIVVTHQKRTMDAADCLYGVSMGGDGVSRVVSRKLEEQQDIRGRVASPRVARGWHELFLTGEPAPEAAEPGEEPEQRGGFFRRLRENMTKTRQALGRRAAGHGVRVARRRGLRAPGGDADLRRRRRSHHGQRSSSAWRARPARASCRAGRT